MTSEVATATGCEEHAFRAMGTSVHVLVPSGFGRAAHLAETVFAEEEQRFSRFRGTSELTWVNRRAGRWTSLSPRFAEVAALALRAARTTGGLFDPSVLDAVIAAGYDREFDEVLAGARGALHPASPCGRWREIELTEDAIRMPAGVGLDLGGIAKGATADLAAEATVASGVPWTLVSAGGDLRLAGDAPAIGVGIEDPGDPAVCAARLSLTDGALATSSITARAWGEGRHHLIDPRTGTPSRSETIQATAWAPTCGEAETLATWALLTGPEATQRIPCAIVGADGALSVSFPTEAAA